MTRRTKPEQLARFSQGQYHDASEAWRHVQPIPTALMRDWVRRRLMSSRIAGQLTLDALRDLFSSRDDRS
ncbi:MAG: hypothetical protein JNM50_03935 [Chromatiales bacterium]|jgi:hypothetical protein|nr:hypothetical protein [Chromatiales bacterium]